MLTQLDTSATRKNGAVRSRSPRFSGRNHQRMSKSSAGSGATDPLLSNANTNAAKLSPYQRFDGDVEGGDACADCVSAFRYQRIDSRKKSIAIRFLRCEIHATVSTFTGCTAKNSAARNAAGRASFRKMRQISRASAMCRIRLVTW